MNPATRLLLGRGHVPESLRDTLRAEGVLVEEEGLRGSVTYLHYRAPGERASWKRNWVRAALVVTRSRLGVYVRGHPVVNVPFGDVRIARLDLTASDVLTIGLDPHDFHADSSGRVEVMLRCAEPTAVLKYVEAQRRAHGT